VQGEGFFPAGRAPLRTHAAAYHQSLGARQPFRRGDESHASSIRAMCSVWGDEVALIPPVAGD